MKKSRKPILKKLMAKEIEFNQLEANLKTMNFTALQLEKVKLLLFLDSKEKKNSTMKKEEVDSEVEEVAEEVPEEEVETKVVQESKVERSS